MDHMSPFSTSSSGLPLCLSGITYPPAFSKQVADHDRRRKVLKKLKRGECFWALDQLSGAEKMQEYHEIINMVSPSPSSDEDYNNNDDDIEEGVAGGDLGGGVAGDLSSLSSSSCTAKAA